MEAAVRWSPHSTGERKRFLVVDVASPSLTLNEVDSLGKKNIKYHPIARSGRIPNFAAFDWSRTNESLVALGLVSGTTNLLRLHDDGQPVETVTQFRLKQQRKCNSVAFSTQDWLAVAVDKTRGDICLYIYDAKRESNSAPAAEPVRRLCAAEVVSSVKFFPSQPTELVAGIQRQFIRLYDLRDGGYSGNVGNIQASSRNVNNIAIDPLDENYFASAGSTDDPSVTVWDKRWISHAASTGNSNIGAVFEFRPAVNNSVKTTVWSLRYSGHRRGRLAVCSSTGELNVIDMVEGRSGNLSHSNYLPPNPYGGAGPWTSNHYVSETKALENPWHDPKHGRDSKKRIIAYDWISEWENASNFGQGILALRPDREVDVLRVANAKPMASITARNDLSIAFEDLTITEPKAHDETPASTVSHERVNGVTAEDFGPHARAGEDDTLDGTLEDIICDRNSHQVGEMLASSAVQRQRCLRGYLFDCQKNMEIVSGNWQLERLWEIVNRFKEQAAGDGMIYDGLDLSYTGAEGLWSEKIGNSPHRRLPSTQSKVDEAIVGLNIKKDIPAFEGERTNFPEHRQLCLAVCGWCYTVDSLEAECNELIERGQYYQAIVQAVLHDYKHIALNILRTLIRSRTIQNIGLGALLASDEINEEQREMCLWMAADTEDPALKALLTFLATGNWRDVMKTNYLHLGYRVALGLKYLNDTELSGFIQTETARAVKNGDLEGILLTGLGEQAMDLFQTYITRTNDLQTAVLATSHTTPLYVDDVRAELWRETYFTQLQAWRCFTPRSKFLIQHTRLARTRGGQSLLVPPPAQITLACLHCQAPTAGPPGTVCPTCGRHMPRCGLCQQWLGTPREGDDIMAKLMSFCPGCGHGFHADHARQWFGRHVVCPVVDCACACGVGG